MEVRNRALGCFLGVACGDAAGAPLEQLGRAPTPEEVANALRQLGGGAHMTGPGQPTDDTELAICLARALIEMGSTFQLDKIAKWYYQWFTSPPFDCGITCGDAFLSVRRLDPKDPSSPYASTMQAAALHLSVDSKSNGALMRCAPLAIWGWQLNPAQLGLIAMADSSLSHPHFVPRLCSAAYVIALAHLIRTGEGEGAVQAAKHWLEEQQHGKDILAWFEEEIPPYWPMSGFVKIAFLHSFRHLVTNVPFEDAIAETLLGGGDTDTNAAIVGGMMGAIHGATGIPKHLQFPVLNRRPERDRPRPDWLSTVHLPSLVDQLLKVAPDSSTFTI